MCPQKSKDDAPKRVSFSEQGNVKYISERFDSQSDSGSESCFLHLDFFINRRDQKSAGNENTHNSDDPSNEDIIYRFRDNIFQDSDDESVGLHQNQKSSLENPLKENETENLHSKNDNQEGSIGLPAVPASIESESPIIDSGFLQLELDRYNPGSEVPFRVPNKIRDVVVCSKNTKETRAQRERESRTFEFRNTDVSSIYVPSLIPSKEEFFGPCCELPIDNLAEINTFEFEPALDFLVSKELDINAFIKDPKGI